MCVLVFTCSLLDLVLWLWLWLWLRNTEGCGTGVVLCCDKCVLSCCSVLFMLWPIDSRRSRSFPEVVNVYMVLCMLPPFISHSAVAHTG